MNTSEKIATLEALLVRVQKRAQEPRAARAAVEAAPAVQSFEHIPETPIAESPATVDFAPPATAAPVVQPAISAVIAPTAAIAAVPAPTATPIAGPTTTKSGTASYVAKGGMSEELPDFDLEDEDEDEESDEESDEIIVEETAEHAATPEVSATSQASAEPEEAEELAIPLRPSTQMRAVPAPLPIEIPASTDDLVLEDTPLASALPAATEEAIALQARKIPPQSVPAMPSVATSLDELDLDLHVAPTPPAATPEFKTPAQTQAVDEPEPTLVTQSIDLPLEIDEPKVEAPIPLVQPARAAEPAPPAAEPPAIETKVAAAPVEQPVVAAVPPAVEAAPAVAAQPVAAPVVAAPVVEAKAPVQPITHDAAALPEADVFAIDHELPREPMSFAKLLRRSLSLRVK